MRFVDVWSAPWMQVLIIYLQYNFIASKLPLNWPSGLINFVGGIQIFFSSGEGIFSLDCLLQVLCSPQCFYSACWMLQAFAYA